MSFAFPKSHRLSGPAQFDAVYAAKARDSRGPLLLYARPNELPHARLGLSVSRKVGNAVRRNRVKRLLREAFRLNRHAWPTGYDWVIVVRPHGGGSVDDYTAILSDLTKRLDGRWKKARESGVGFVDRARVEQDALADVADAPAGAKNALIPCQPAGGEDDRVETERRELSVDQLRATVEAIDENPSAVAPVKTELATNVTAPTRAHATLPARGLMLLVVAYRVTLGRFLGGQCRFYPTCSQYALDALAKHGAWRGGLMTVRRLARCRPGGPSGFDPA